MSYYPEPDSHIRDKVKIVSDLPNYGTKKELEYATGVDTSDLAAKKDFIDLKAEIDKLGINKLINVPTSLNNSKTSVDDLDVGKLKTVPLELKKLSDLVDNEKKKKMLVKKMSDTSNLVTTTVLNTKINKVENKIPDNSKYNTTQEFNKLTAENFAARLKQAAIANKTDFDNKTTSLIDELLQIKQSI